MHPCLDDIRSELRSALEAHYGDRLARLLLYGSQARGDARRYSDIDVLVVLKDEVDSSAETRRTSDIRYRLSLEYTTVVTFAYVSEKRFGEKGTPFFLNVRKEGVRL
jgi:predicted nucleotidyltransferase